MSISKDGVMRLSGSSSDAPLNLLSRTSLNDVRNVGLATGLSWSGGNLKNDGILKMNSTILPDANGNFNITASNSSGITTTAGTNSIALSTNTVWSRMKNNTVQNTGAYSTVIYSGAYDKNAAVLESNTSTGIIDVKVSGDYEISFSCNAWVTTGSTSGILTLKIKLGTTDNDITIEQYIDGDGKVAHIEFNDIKNLTTTDDIKVVSFHAAMSNFNLDEAKLTVKKL